MTTVTTFSDFGLPTEILDAIAKIGFTTPSPIQQQTIFPLLEGKDVLGIAQTGSGKTAAFGLPLLCQLDVKEKYPQMLVLTPTRELAMQVAEALEQFSANLKGIKVAQIYGGQRYDTQLRALKNGVQVIVGTPGRILDHLKRRSLDLSKLRALVLDEADEMLRMGFLEDVETIMDQLPESHQTALFSATMPEPIRRISKKFMQNAIEIRIAANQKSAPDIKQSFWFVKNTSKQDALLRFLEVEEFDACIIFTRTKTGTIDVMDLCRKGGWSAEALNGDMTQQAREQTLDKLRDGKIDILVATDVAARGLDVERISLVVNYDITLDSESYVHRIGRTGRAGRSGRALLFVERRELRLLKNIERLIKKQIDEIDLPSNELLVEKRRERFKKLVSTQLEDSDIDKYRALLGEIFAEQDTTDLAVAMMMLLEKEQKLILPPTQKVSKSSRTKERDKDRSNFKSERRERLDVAMNLYRIEVGKLDGVEVRHIVGAIANEGDISSRFIGHIKLYEEFSTVELPAGIPDAVLKHFANKARVLNKPMQMREIHKESTKTKRSRKNKY